MPGSWPALVVWERGKLACVGGGGGGVQAPQRKGGGCRKGALVTGRSQEASLKPLMMTHHQGCKAARKIFFSKKISPMIHTSKLSAHRGGSF